jgi:hypothetical protein
MTDRNYKMSKWLKTMLRTMPDVEMRPIYKNLFKEAESHSANVKRKMSIKIVDTESDE